MDDSFDCRLEQLLSEPEESIRWREQRAFDQIAGEAADSIVLFGTGGLGRRILTGLRKLGIEPRAFADNNSRLWDHSVEGTPVFSPQEAVEKFGADSIFVVAIWSDKLGHPLAKVTEQLQSFGAVKVVSFAALFWKYPAVYLPYFGLDLPHRICGYVDAVREAGKLWSEPASQEQYLAQLRWRLWLDPEPMETSPVRPQYSIFIDGEKPGDAVILDCGAFNGDTVKFIIEQQTPFKHLLAFEPDPANCAALRQYLKTLPEEIGRKVSVFQAATGTRREKLRFSSAGSDQSAVSADGDIEVDCVPLDEVAHDFHPTCIKMDIEGAEPEALVGARRIIADYSPKLAISIYHQFDHLWSLPLLIRELGPQYHLSLYPMSKGGWDFMCIAERG